MPDQQAKYVSRGTLAAEQSLPLTLPLLYWPFCSDPKLCISGSIAMGGKALVAGPDTQSAGSGATAPATTTD